MFDSGSLFSNETYTLIILVYPWLIYDSTNFCVKYFIWAYCERKTFSLISLFLVFCFAVLHKIVLTLQMVSVFWMRNHRIISFPNIIQASINSATKLQNSILDIELFDLGIPSIHRLFCVMIYWQCNPYNGTLCLLHVFYFMNYVIVMTLFIDPWSHLLIEGKRKIASRRLKIV